MPEATLQDTIRCLEPLNTQDFRNLKKYYHMAKENQEIYSRLSVVHHLIYNQPYHLITSDKKNSKQSEQSKIVDSDHVKQKVKVFNEVSSEVSEYGKAA